jgi:hypothetical protein
MKTEWIRTGSRKDRKSLKRWPAVGVLAIATALTANLEAQDKTAVAGNACLRTAADVFASCKSGAQSDYQVAMGKCVNITDPAAQKACEKQATSDLADALETCQAGLQVRQEACQRLGPAAYDPVIDPANFTTVRGHS